MKSFFSALEGFFVFTLVSLIILTDDYNEEGEEVMYYAEDSIDENYVEERV